MSYQTFNPHAELTPFVKCYWTLQMPEEAQPQPQRIVPDGCLEMIFHLGDLYRQYLSDGSSIIQPKCFVFGQITQPLEIEPTGMTNIFAVRFHPEGFAPLMPTSHDEMENRANPLEELFGEDGIRLENNVLNSATNEERIAIVESFLTNRLNTSEARDIIAKSCVEAILELDGNLSVDELSKQLKINRRQLERKFAAAIGLSPKQLSKMIRMQSTLKMLVSNRNTSLTSIAYDGNYYDQAHFIKDFKEFTGMTPKQFFAGNLKMSALLLDSE